MNSPYVLKLKTIQVPDIRKLVTSLKDMLTETNIIFTREGMKIVTVDNTQTIFVRLALYAENFEEYECKEPRIVAGVNVITLYKLINIIDNRDVLTIYIAEEDYQDGTTEKLSLVFENEDTGQTRYIKMNMMILGEEEPDAPPPVEYSTMSMLSSDFQKIIRDMSSISAKVVEIKSVGNELIFQSTGQSASLITKRKEPIQGESVKSTKIIQGKFELKFLLLIIKCTSLSQHVEINLENDRPIIVKYDIGSLGDIRLCCATCYED